MGPGREGECQGQLWTEGVGRQEECGLTLEGDETPAVEDLKLDRLLGTAVSLAPLGELLSEEGEVLDPPAGVGDNVKRLCVVLCDDRVVDDAAGLVEEHRQPALALAERAEVSRAERLEKGLSARAAKERLDHVTDVKETGVRPDVSVRREARRRRDRVRERHQIAGKRHHLGALLDMVVMQRRLAEVGLKERVRLRSSAPAAGGRDREMVGELGGRTDEGKTSAYDRRPAEGSVAAAAR